MLKTIKELLKVILSGLFALIVLSGFTTIYCNSGIHITNKAGSTDYKWEPYQLKTTMSEGFAWLRMDNNGFNNAVISEEPINYLLMGSSHMEASNVDSSKNLGYLLNQKLIGRTYNIGVSGHQIYSCVRNLGNAIDEYKPTDYVIIETDRVALDINSMKKVMDNTYSRIASHDTGLIYIVQKYLPSLKCIYNQVDVWRKEDSKYNKVTDKETVEERNEFSSEEYAETLDDFLSFAVKSAHNTKLIIVYHPKTHIDSEGNMIKETNDRAVTLFKETCEMQGIVFVDMTQSFENSYYSDHVLAHGFVNTAIGEGHLNATGHALMAEELIKVIEGVEHDSE